MVSHTIFEMHWKNVPKGDKNTKYLKVPQVQKSTRNTIKAKNTKTFKNNYKKVPKKC